MRIEQGIAVGASILAIGGGVMSIRHGNDLEKGYNNQQCPQVLPDVQCSAENGNIEGWKEGGLFEILGGIGLIGVVLIVSGNGDAERPKTQLDSESLPPAQS
jgi:hypothetical protein